MSFSHDIAGGQGNLIISSLQSPNYDPDEGTGWQIESNGDATFYSISLPGFEAGVKVTFSSTAPADPHTGDLWYNTADGLQVSQWTGTEWELYLIGGAAIQSQSITSTEIANATITGTQLAASVTARSLGGITTTISSTAPSSPKTGDIWIDSASGNQMNQYTGTAWTPISWTATDVLSAATITSSLIAAATITGGNIAAGTIQASNIAANTITASQIAANTITAAQIASGTITATQIAAGTVVAGIVNGTTITGAQLIGDGSGEEVMIYTGTPATGNLIASVSSKSGTDGHSNAYEDGIASYGPNKGIAQLAANQTSGVPYVVLYPSGATHLAEPPQINGTWNGPASEEQEVLNLYSGYTTDNTNQCWFYLESADYSGTYTAEAGLTIANNAIWTATSDYLQIQSPMWATNPSTNGYETWHTITLDAHWITVSGYPSPRYRLLPDGNLQLSGIAQYTGTATGTVSMNSSNPLPSGWQPLYQVLGPATYSNRCAWQILPSSNATPGVIQGVGVNPGSTSYCEINYILAMN